jgi:hypothetical protein
LGSVDPFELTVTAIAHESANGDSRSVTRQLPVTVDYVFVPFVEVDGIVVNGGQDQRSTIHSLSVGFNQDVWFDGLAKSLSIVQLPPPGGDETRIQIAEDRISYDPESFTVIIDTTGLLKQDAHYQLRMDCSGVRAAAARDMELADQDIDLFQITLNPVVVLLRLPNYHAKLFSARKGSTIARHLFLSSPSYARSSWV